MTSARDEINGLLEQLKSAGMFVDRLVQMAKRHPDEKVAAEVLAWWNQAQDYCGELATIPKEKKH